MQEPLGKSNNGVERVLEIHFHRFWPWWAPPKTYWNTITERVIDKRQPSGVNSSKEV